MTLLNYFPIKCYKKISIFDLFFYLYLLAMVREFFWVIQNQYVAWMGALLVSAFLWLLFANIRIRLLPYKCKLDIFFIMPAIILCIFYFITAMVPDEGYDTMRIRLWYGEASLYGYPFSHYMTLVGTNTISEMMFAIIRHLIGMRLSTVLNLIAILWGAYESREIIAKYTKNNIVICIFVSYILLGSEMLYMNIGCSFADLLGLPLLMMVFRLVLSKEHDDKVIKLAFISFLLGLAFAIKYSNLTFIAPLGLVALFNQRHLIIQKPYILSCFIIFIIPNIPFMLYTYYYFQSPLFPFYNAFFKSPYYADINYKDTRWGPHSLLEGFLWPILIVFKQYTLRFSEMFVGTQFLHNGRIGLAYIIALVAIPISVYRQKFDILKSALIVVCGLFLWSLSNGYSRYELPFEYILMSFVFIVLILISKSGFLAKVSSAVIVIALFLSFLVTLTYFRRDVVWGFAGIIHYRDIPSNIRYYKEFFKDKDIYSYLSVKQKSLFSQVDLWLWYSGSNATFLGAFINGAEIVIQDRFPQHMLLGKTFYDLVEEKYLDSVMKNAKTKGYVVEEVIVINLPYFGQENMFKYLLVKMYYPEDRVDYNYKQIPYVPYLSLSPKEVISNADEDKLLFIGWNNSENTHRWSWVKEPLIYFKIDDPDTFSGYLKIQFGTANRQRVAIKLNGVEIVNTVLELELFSTVGYKFDKRLLKRGSNLLEFILPDAYASSDDAPKLSIALNNLTIE